MSDGAGRFLCFAYGSNMLTTRLRGRCPGAMPLGAALLAGYHLSFTKIGRDGSGKETISKSPGHAVPGVLFAVPQAKLAALDRAEGNGRGYERRNFAVLPEGQQSPCIAATCFETRLSGEIRPFGWYLALVIAGRPEHGIAPDGLPALPHETGRADNFPSATKGRRALARAGHDDWRSLPARPLQTWPQA